MPEWVILVGYVGGGIGRGLVVGVVVMGIAAGFGVSRPVHPEIVAAMFFLTATLFSLAGFLNALFASSFDDISIVPNFVLTPLVYLGGVFYSVELLPGFWRNLSHLNPILYMVNAFRYGFLGASDVSVALAFAMTSFLILLLTIVALVLLKRGTGLKT
jgi:ABC-2 type transport system permease protein